MRLKITCSACACRYAVIGAAFFCPACGHNAADHLFVQSISGIARVLDSLPNIRMALPDRDVAEVTARHAIENGLQNAVTSFQRYAEVLYSRFSSAPAARRNVFQNLKEGGALWKGVSGKNFADYLGTNEVVNLRRLFQQRHLLAHTEGVVDQDYIVRSGDTSYAVGQRIVVRERSVRDFLTILRKLAEAMANDCP